jgi:APA family basic amino acid/polyamine antiporter
LQTQESPGLIRALGRWTLTALVLNSIVGSGIFGLPSIVAGYLGKQSPFAYLLAAAATGVIIACFAEVGSQFQVSGGPYLYVREAFGALPAIEVGWLLALAQVTATAAATNLFTNYLVEFWPTAREPRARLVVITLLIWFLAAVNYLGVKSGAVVSNFFALAKLVPLFGFGIAGAISLLHAHHGFPATAVHVPIPIRNWFEAVLILMFVFGGFEGAITPMAEASDPRRDIPFALYAALGITVVLYLLIQLVVVAVLPDPAGTARPIADAARQLWGSSGAGLISAGALISIYGNLSSHMLRTPRLTFALGERGDFPRFFARVHARFRTPHNSILVFSAIAWALAIIGDFKWNVLISSVGRLIPYGFVCASLPVFRRTQPNANAYRLPAGSLFAILGVALMLALLLRISRMEALIVLATGAVALANWFWVRSRAESARLH